MRLSPAPSAAGASGAASAARPASREVLAAQSVAAFLADGERPVADRDYVVVRGSRFACSITKASVT